MPTMKWKITKSGDFSELGMTFSTPRVTRVMYSGTPVTALIFAGGYDGGFTVTVRSTTVRILPVTIPATVHIHGSLVVMSLSPNCRKG